MVYVEYLQNGNEGSRGTGWGIDLGFTPSSGNIKMKCKTYYPNSNQDGGLFIGASETRNDFFRFFSYNSQGMVFDCPTDSNNGRVGPLAYTGVTEWEMAISVNGNTNSTYLKNLTNNTIVSSTNTYTWTHSKQFKVWKGTSSQTTQGTQVYWIEIYQDDVKVREYVPALDNNNIPCLYEKLNGTYHYNTGNTLTVGPVLSSIIVTASKTVLAATGETINIVVDCENAWEVSGSTFLTLSATGGTGSTTITATAPSYIGASARTDTLTFTDSVTGDEAEITIKQKKYTNGQPLYLGADEISEIYLGADAISEAYLGDVLVFSAVAPTPTGGTRVISISSIPIPVTDGENAGGTDIYIEDENENYASLNLTYSDPSDETSYEENVDASQGFNASYDSGYFEVEGEWGDDITINYSYTDGACESVPSEYETEQPTFENGVISTSFPTPESDPGCECEAQGGTWDGVECTYPEPDPCEGMGEEECECVQNGGTWIVPEIGDPYCEQGGEVDCEGDPECLCTQAGGTWTYDDMTDTYHCDCGGDPECECISAGGTWDGSDCTYPE